MNDEQKMKVAIDLAKEAMDTGEMPIAAVVFHGDRIVSSAYTSEKSDKRFLVHAELKALIAAESEGIPFKTRKEMQLYTTLEPCLMCMGAAMSFFVGEIVFALEAPMDGSVNIVENYWNKECNEIPSYGLPKIRGGILRNESRSLFAEFIRHTDSGTYYKFAKTLAELK